MIRYDWEVLRYEPTEHILTVIYTLINFNRTTVCKGSVLKTIAKFRDKSSYLLNPTGLILNRKKYTDWEIDIYLELAAMRSYNKYKETGSCRLPTYYIEDRYDIERLNMSTILNVTNEEIIFIYEET